MASWLSVINIILVLLVLVSRSRADNPPCPTGLAGSSTSNLGCAIVAGRNENGTGTACVPAPLISGKRKRQNVDLLNITSFVQEYPYQASPYFKPSAVLRGCTGSVVTTFDTEDANLAGRGQTVVSQRPSCLSTVPIELVSGLGNSVHVIEEDIILDGWLIHITDGFFTIPTLLSSTLQTINGVAQFANATDSSLSSFDFVPSITAFVTSDSAFATALRCSQGSTAKINPLALLRANIVTGSVAYSPQLVDGAFFRSTYGEDITVSVINGTKYVNNAPVVEEDIVIQNGVVHIIGGLVSDEGLICPPTPSSAPNTSCITTMLTTNIITNIVSNLTTTVTKPPTSILTTTVNIAPPPVTTFVTDIISPTTAFSATTVITTVLITTGPTTTVFSTKIIPTTILSIDTPTIVLTTMSLTTVLTTTTPTIALTTTASSFATTLTTVSLPTTTETISDSSKVWTTSPPPESYSTPCPESESWTKGYNNGP
ncbi:hypothetical protein BP6252_06515 [Coleophoma cylindrospora]|uniref:FAS1 domain-containing protein n=1 Tax=Coleophoma cylindrospora TaxID=1849047 RepID=A0A3D8RMV2_9HELO|nr:hypothetical protein BP6252_06515 [Coleophoma cylindrospora]